MLSAEVEGETDEEKAAAETAKTAAVEEKTAAVTKAEEALKEKEEAKPEVPATRKVRKEQVKTKTVTQPILKCVSFFAQELHGSACAPSVGGCINQQSSPQCSVTFRPSSFCRCSK